ncbi:peptidoglycan DD-metalloendopeptidase family protein [uncultured Oxalicibacterium sp.]|uniref:peptidoglycan DD-metalloendopeptidase family protein n=1 Tax=uncultured Oxalicibacterium sp. TaxID=1168540 RepID=UPI0025E41A8F|nr:peptidoglycan DD-metalloendopeptidase family protein [uncultured Oxalicibacterium sp.]
MNKLRLTCVALTLTSLAACTTAPRSPAPVSDRTTGSSTSASAPKKADESGYYTVKRGDTLYRIALDFGQSYSELVTWNNLSNPNDIKVGQVLRVTSPDAGGRTSGGAQVGAVATSSGVETRSLSTPPSTPANKTTPNGEKRPYSETAANDAQKSDTAGDEDAVSWMWPAEGRVISSFDDNKKGVDIAGKSGQPVLAAGAGKVMYAGSGIRGYGNLVIVKHTNTLLSAYAHNKSIAVKEGQSVTKGQKIAEMGDSDADSVKLHFEIRQQGKPVDPSKFLPAR